MRPGLGVDLTLRPLLDAVVPDRTGRIDPRIDVGLGQILDQPGLDRMIRPDAGVAVGLQFCAHRASLGPAPLLGPAERAEKILHMVAVLVGNHVGLGERPALGPEARLQLSEEAEIDVDLLVGRAVERPHLRARGAAARLHRVREEDGLRGRVALDGT